MKNLRPCFFAALLPALFFFSCAENNRNQVIAVPESTQPSTLDTCDDPDADICCSFAQMPAELSSVMQIAPPGEPGEQLVIRGKITKSDGKTPVAGAILYCYHTNEKGIYAKKGGETGVLRWHGHLHGWCRADTEGRYEIRTIRPARYPSNNLPAHIHPAIWVEGSEPCYLTDFVFSDDNLVDEKYLRSLGRTPGGTGVVNLKKNTTGVWEGERVIMLEQ